MRRARNRLKWCVLSEIGRALLIFVAYGARNFESFTRFFPTNKSIYCGRETKFSYVKAAFAPTLNLSSLIGLAQLCAYGHTGCILCRTASFDVTKLRVPATVLEAYSWLLICRIGPRESKKHARDEWFEFFNASMSTHWAIRRVISIGRKPIDSSDPIFGEKLENPQLKIRSVFMTGGRS